MKHIEFLIEGFQKHAAHPAIVWKGQTYTYQWLLENIQKFEADLGQKGVKSGSVVNIEGDFSPQSISIFLALTARSCIIAPMLRTASETQKLNIAAIAQTEFHYSIDENDEVAFSKTSAHSQHELYSTIRKRKHPGLVLFSSGSSGKPKAAVHDFLRLLEKFKEPRHAMKILNFLLFDHWGGLNTMLHTLSNGGTVFTVQERSPAGICAAIEAFKIEVLPASPTFINLMLISNSHRKYDLSSLKIVSYGTEPMPEVTLRRAREALPHVKLQQTYGLIELGVLRTKSKSDDSLWVKLGGEGYETRVVDGLLQIQARSAMLGYLNAPSPFTDDGWFMTGDAVEVEGEYFKILGRKSELINVGGEKVYPQEVESVIQDFPNIAEVTVYGEKSPLVGNIVCAKIRLTVEEDPKILISSLKKYCREKMASFKVPVKIEVLDEAHYNERFKKIRIKDSSTLT